MKDGSLNGRSFDFSNLTDPESCVQSTRFRQIERPVLSTSPSLWVGQSRLTVRISTIPQSMDV